MPRFEHQNTGAPASGLRSEAAPSYSSAGNLVLADGVVVAETRGSGSEEWSRRIATALRMLDERASSLAHASAVMGGFDLGEERPPCFGSR